MILGSSARDARLRVFCMPTTCGVFFKKLAPGLANLLSDKCRNRSTGITPLDWRAYCIQVLEFISGYIAPRVSAAVEQTQSAQACSKTSHPLQWLCLQGGEQGPGNVGGSSHDSCFIPFSFSSLSLGVNCSIPFAIICSLNMLRTVVPSSLHVKTQRH